MKKIMTIHVKSHPFLNGISEKDDYPFHLL